MFKIIFGLRSMGKSHAVRAGLVRHIVGPHFNPREAVAARDPVLIDLLDRSLAGEHVDLRKHLTGG